MYKFLLFIFSLNSFCYGDELLSVVVIFRHGARTPIDPYPNDPYGNESSWPVDFGQLLDEGKKQHFELGHWFRTRYTGFMPDRYSEKDIYVRSTDVDRSLMSAEANLAGFYPPKKEFYPNLPWQPIPIHTIKKARDEVLAMKRPCSKYDKVLEDLYAQPFFQNISRTYQDLYAYLTKHSGRLVNNPVDVSYIYDTLTIEKNFNLTLPAWTETVYPQKMEYLSLLSFALEAYTPQLARLKTGPLFDLITKHFKSMKDRNQSSEENIWHRKFLMFSAHDITISTILQAMGLFDMHFPPYAASLLFELRQRQDNSTYLNLFYKNSTNPVQLTLKGCEADCDLDKFIDIIKPITVDSETWMKECEQLD